MPKRKSLRKPRTQAFEQQNGRCFYCNQPMWLESHNELTSHFNVTSRQARHLQCTGEHLTPLSQQRLTHPRHLIEYPQRELSFQSDKKAPRHRM